MELLGNRNSKVLVIGCFHGDEPQGKFLIESYLQANPNTSIAFIPCLNKWGFENNLRVNKNGVDLNRNFPTSNWLLTKKDEFWSGPFPKSEIETNFIIKTVEKLSPKLILTLHAPFKIVNYDGDAREISEMISKITGYPVEPSVGYPTPGSFGTWAGIEKAIPTVTLELDETVAVEELKLPIFEVFTLLEN